MARLVKGMFGKIDERIAQTSKANLKKYLIAFVVIFPLYLITLFSTIYIIRLAFNV